MVLKDLVIEEQALDSIVCAMVCIYCLDLLCSF